MTDCFDELDSNIPPKPKHLLKTALNRAELQFSLRIQKDHLSLFCKIQTRNLQASICFTCNRWQKRQRDMHVLLSYALCHHMMISKLWKVCTKLHKMPWPFKSAFKVLWHSYIGIVLRNIKNIIKVNKFFLFFWLQIL